jgi:hypothetical protein
MSRPSQSVTDIEISGLPRSTAEMIRRALPVAGSRWGNIRMSDYCL